jgi:hypothetical protein
VIGNQNHNNNRILPKFDLNELRFAKQCFIKIVSLIGRFVVRCTNNNLLVHSVASFTSTDPLEFGNADDFVCVM